MERVIPVNDFELRELRRDAEAMAMGQTAKYAITAKDLMRLFDHIDNLEDQLSEAVEAQTEAENELNTLQEDYYELEAEVDKFRSAS